GRSYSWGPPQEGFDIRTERVDVDRLAQVAVESTLQEALAIADHRVGGHRDDGELRQARIGADLSQQQLAAAAGEPDVEQHHLWHLDLQEGARLADRGHL